MDRELKERITNRAVKVLLADLQDLREYKKDIEDTFKRIMEERCPTDEVHCTCVPYLVMEVNRLKKMIRQQNNIPEEEDI